MANNNSGRDKNEKDLVCSFCGKHQDEVERMIIGPVSISAANASACATTCFPTSRISPKAPDRPAVLTVHTSSLRTIWISTS